MTKSVLFLVAILFALLVSGAPLAAQDTPTLDVTNYTLDNGLEVILVEDHSAPTVAVNVFYHVGSAHDPEGRSGFAHLFEHLMFQRTAHLDEGDIFGLFEAAGGGGNAYTSIEQTVYYESLPAHQLPLALWVEAERMASLVIDQENLDNERAVVIEEYNRSVANAPYGEAGQVLYTLPYDYAPYQRPTIGSVEDLNAASVEDVIAFHALYYVPNNATLVVAGDIDVSATRALIDTYFADIPAGEEPPALPAYAPSPDFTGQRVALPDPLANIPTLYIGYPVPSYTEPDYAALEVAARILGQGNSSRLALALMDTGLSPYAVTFTRDGRGPSLFAAVAYANAGVELAQLEDVYTAELARLAEDGPIPEELDKTISQIRSERFFGLERASDLAEGVQYANFYFDDPQAVFSEVDRFRDVTAEDVQRVVGQYLTPQRAVILEIAPGERPEATQAAPFVGEASDATSEPRHVLEQAEPPEPLTLREFTLPDITERALDNGLEVVVIPRPEIPIISLDLVFPGGESTVPPELTGLSAMTASLLTRGTETRSAQQIATEAEEAGGGYGAGASGDAVSIGIYALSEHTPLAFELLGDMAMHSVFPDGELELKRQEALTGLEFALSDPASVAGRAFGRLVYGDHPYGKLETPDTIDALTREDVLAFYAREIVPGDAFLIVTGDVTVDDGLRLAEATFGAWEGDDPDPDAIPEPEQAAAPGIYLVDRPGSTQVSFLIGTLGMEGASPRRFAAQVMNELFGGGVASRLWLNLREDKGYTYGIGSSFGLPASTGTFRISMDTRNDVAGEALQAILDEVARLQSEPITDAELERTKQARIGRQALALETYQDFVETIMSSKLRGLPLSTLADYVGNVEAVDQEAIQAVAREFIDPERFVIVAVGDAEAIRDELEAIAPVTTIEAE